MARKTLVEKDTGDLKGKNWVESLVELVKRSSRRKRIFAKLIELVKKRKSFEEESLMYKYEGKDKDEIWSCMEFFYQNLYNLTFNDFIWHDDNDDWENYNFTLKYHNLYSEVNIVYGIGSFCVIKPVDGPNAKTGKILDLERIVVLTTGEIIYND